MKIKFCYFLSIGLMLICCRKTNNDHIFAPEQLARDSVNTDTSERTQAKYSPLIHGSKIEDFDPFIKKFVRDLKFQESRIIFPVPEKVEIVGGEEEVYYSYWQKEDMPLVIDSPKDNNVKCDTIRSSEVITIECRVPKSGALVRIGFKNLDGKWYLFYLRQSVT